MNIVCNNCIGARLYEVTKQQFPNPFMWMLIMHKDYINFINEYDNLDLQNPKFELEIFNNNKRKSVLITLNNIKLHYIHYIQDESKEIPVKEKSTNILYKDILSYAKNKWFSRLNRMVDDPIFVYSLNGFKFSDEEYNKRIKDVSLINDKCIYLITYESKQINIDLPNNIKVIYVKDEIMDSTTAAVAKYIKNIITNNE